MSLQACAELLERGDPDRFRAAMAAPPEARKVLFPLWALNLEVARAPWVTEEPLIAEMRLQWWKDALEEIAQGGPVRRHEVTTPLAEAIKPEDANLLSDLVDARRRDISGEPFADLGALTTYLNRTSGHLTWAGMRALGADPRAEDAARDFALATGLARYLKAAPDLVARGREPFPVDPTSKDMRALISEKIRRLKHATYLRFALGKVQTAPLLDGWMAGLTLMRAQRAPARILAGQLGASPFRERLGLIMIASARRWRPGKHTLENPPRPS